MQIQLHTSSPAIKKHLLMQQFISLLLIFRSQLYDLNIYIFYAILILFMAGKYLKEGNTVGSILQYLAVVLLGVGDLCGWEGLVTGVAVIAVVNYVFVAPKVYTLPEYREKVGLRDNYLKRNNKLFYYAEWFPVLQNENCENYQIPWNHTIQLNKIAEYLSIKKIMPLFKFFTSYIRKYKLNLAKGDPAPHRGYILFSHGRTGTPFLYSSILKNFARNWKIFSPQHSEVKKTPYTDFNQIKRFRQIEVSQRAEEIIFLASKVPEKQEIVLMGHSYGCATILQAYSKLHLSIRKRVSHIILLDPWLFPLTQAVFEDEIVCPILMLSNQHFLKTRDTYIRNKKFVNRQGSKLVYFCWQGGDHLHQTDLQFIAGTTLNVIKNAKDCQKYHEINIQAIEMFLDFKKAGVQEIEQIKNKFGEYDLGIEYTPQKWNTKFSF